MKQSLCIAIFMASLSFTVNALSLDWLQPMIDPVTSPWHLEQLQDSTILYDCGMEEEDREFCSDIVKYYNVDVNSRLFVTNGLVNEIELTAPFSPSAYTELQLNLRKDGYVLSKAQIEDKHFDVISELAKSSIKLVNRQLVMFLNQGSISTDRKLTWFPNSEYYQETPSRYVHFVSGTTGIKVTFYQLGQ